MVASSQPSICKESGTIAQHHIQDAVIEYSFCCHSMVMEQSFRDHGIIIQWSRNNWKDRALHRHSPFLNSLGFMPFMRWKKRAKVVTSAKCRRSEICVILSEVWRKRKIASMSRSWLM